jgi:hypothetical protein
MNDYMMNTFIGPSALFDRETWNCFGQKHRTINVCEGYHSVINDQFRGVRPDPYKFIDFFEATGSVNRKENRSVTTRNTTKKNNKRPLMFMWMKL